MSELPPTLRKALADAAAGRLGDALAMTRTRLRVSPGDPRTVGVMAFLLMQSGDIDGAIEQFERALRLGPEVAHAHANLASALFHRHRFADAERHYARALQLLPTYLPAIAGIVVTKTHLGDIDGAIAAADAALERQPEQADVIVNKSHALTAAARVEEAAACLRMVLKRQPQNRRIMTGLAFTLNYLSLPPEDILRLHQEYGAATPSAKPTARSRPLDPGRPLRVGILSSDLRSHSVGYFLLPAIRARPDGFRLVCFSTSASKPGDPMVAALRQASDEWIDVGSTDDAGLDREIRQRSVDVLVELNGHSLGNRLTALDRQPAPVIVTAIGYPNTTGHPAVGWRIVDSTTDPQGSDRLCTERLLRIDPCFLCYDPPAGAPDPALPADGTPLTFGSFNHAAKIQDATAAAWGLLLRALPDSRLLLKSQTLRAKAASETILARLERHGVTRDRVEVIAYTDTVEEHLKLYSRMHVALDTMPYNGTTTTCEALWMGVPVVTMTGVRHASRVSASLLAAAGCPELVGSDAKSFCEIAARIARDPAKLLEYRRGLRSQMMASPLMDATAYAKRFFGALRDAWDAQGATPSPGGSAT